MKFLEHISINPPVPLKKGNLYPFVEMANVGVNRREPLQIAYKVFSSGVKFQDGDSVVARIEPCLQNGKKFFCHNIEAGFGSTEYLVFRPKDDKIDSLYLYYFLQTDYIRKSMIGSMTGATGRQRVNNAIFKSLEIEIPKIEIQKSIANILSAYDNLIENNQKQIKLLEEAALRLYKEWFVDLRFPGYETTPVVDGVPEGWRYRVVAEFGNIITGKTPSTSKPEYYGGTIPFVTIPDMHNQVYPLLTEKTLTNTGANTQKNKFIPAKSILVSCIATVGLVNIAFEMCQTNQQINSVVLFSEKDLYFVYESMLRIKDLLDGVGSNGATMTNVNKTKFSNIRILCPPEPLIDAFYDWCMPVFEKIMTLSQSILKAQQARDRLLPKLMSGEMEI